MNFNDIADVDSIRLDTPIASDSVPRWQRKAEQAQLENSLNVARAEQRTPAKPLAASTPKKTPVGKTPKVRKKQFFEFFFEIFLKFFCNGFFSKRAIASLPTVAR
jgi:hypothetical protein